MTSANTASIETPALSEQREISDKPTPLHVGTEPPLEPAAIARWIEPQIAEQIERAAWWPGHELRDGWKLGDYCIYWMGFASLGFKSLYVRFISEPDRTV